MFLIRSFKCYSQESITEFMLKSCFAELVSNMKGNIILKCGTMVSYTTTLRKEYR